MHSITQIGIFVLAISSFVDFSLSEPRVVCYYTNWSVYRPGTAKFNPQNINPYLCTHLIYAFGGFTKDNQLKPFDKYQDIEQGGYAKFTGLKTYNKELKTMLAIGGWNEGSTRFSPLVASSERRSQLVKNAIKFLRQNKFDGLDLDWEYPAYRDGGKAKDRDNYAKLVQELREEFQREHDKTGRPRLLLTMAVPAGFEYIEKGYDVPKLNKHLDWFNLLSYDYHSAYEPSVNHHAPLYPIEEENEYSYDTDLNINATINFYVKAGADREKLVLGIPTYGRSYTLFNEESSEIGAPADGPGEQGDATREKGYLAYYEICQNIKEEDSDWTVVQPNPDALGPYAISGNQWVGYDDEDIVRKKSKFVVEQNLGGIMFWSIDNDDFRGLCNGKAYPLIEAAKEAYLDGLSNGVPLRNAIGSSKPKQTKVATTTRRPDSSKSKSSGKYTTPPPPVTPDPGSDFKCEDEGFYAHPRDCKKYFWCLEAAGLGIVAHQFTCPSGLYFNKAADSCDYSRNVHCSKTETKSTTTEADEPTTTSTRSTPVSTRANPLYKSPSRTTQRTTTAVYEEPSTEATELDQEDPKVIKELIDLIKKVGGVEELERQLNLQEDGAAVTISLKPVQGGATTPPSVINKSLYEKIKNRASVLKTRPAFNGASQPEVKERDETREQKTTSTSTEATSPSLLSKKYNSVNRNSRPGPQSAGIESLPESDKVLIDKPQYTSIRRKPVKPEVISENDYNGDSESASREESSTEAAKKYASINRSRRPQVQPVEEEEDDDDSEEVDELDIPTRSPVTTAKPTTRYVNLSRRRSTTAEPATDRIEENIETTTPSRRRPTPSPTTTSTTTTRKTVLNVTNNRNQIQENTQKKDTVRETLTGKRGLLDGIDDDEDEDGQFNVIAQPTESVTENVPYPENILTTKTSITTQTPNTTPPSIQVTETPLQSESLNDIIDSVDDGSDLVETTTLISGLNIIESSVSKQNDILSSNFANVNSVAPRPFSRPTLSRTRGPTVNETPVNTPETTTKRVTSRRPRPSPAKFTTERTTTLDNEIESTSRPQYSYRPGYRGTARFRTSTVKSGQYDKDEDNLAIANYQPIENNRLRALNLDNQRTRPATTAAPVTQEVRKRVSPLRPRITPSTAKTPKPVVETEEEDEETTTEQRIVEAKNFFNLENGERPERIRFELAVGRKIDFGITPAAKIQSKTSDASKVKVITGPLAQSPLVTSGRELKKGHVEEIPLGPTKSVESVTVKSFSNKLNLNDIPLNKSDVDSFVSDQDLRTDLPDDDTTTKRPRLRPSISGFAKNIQGDGVTNDSTTGVAVDSTTSRSRLRPSKTGVRAQSDALEVTSAAPAIEEITSRFRTRFQQKSKASNEAVEADEEETTSKRSRPLINRFSQKTRVTGSNEANEVEESSVRTRPSGFRNRPTARTRITQETNNEEATVEDSSTTGRTRPSLFKSRFTTKSSQDTSVLEESSEAAVEDESTSKRTRPSAFKSRFPTKSSSDSDSDSTVDDKVSTTKAFKSRFPTRPSIDSDSDSTVDDEFSTTKSRFSSTKGRFTTRTRTSVESDLDQSADGDTGTTGKIRPLLYKNRLTTKIHKEAVESDSTVGESTTGRTRPSAFKSRYTTRSRLDANDQYEDSKVEESTTSRIRIRPILGKVLSKGGLKIEDVAIEDVNDLQTESPEEEIEDTTTVERSSWAPIKKITSKSSAFGGESNSLEETTDQVDLDSATEKSSDESEEENEIDYTTGATIRGSDTGKAEIADDDDDDDDDNDDTTLEPLIETTSSTTRRSVVVRKRPVKKIDVVATRQTITEATEEEVDEPQKSSTETVTRTRPTRKLVTRRRLESENQNQESTAQEGDSVNVAQPRPTRKRVIFTRTRPRVTEDGDEASESPAAVDNADETSEKPNDSSTRRRVKVFRTRPSTERAVQEQEEASSRPVNPLSRTRVFKRPLPVSEEKPVDNENISQTEDEEAAPPKSYPRFGDGRQRKIVKVNRKPVASEDDQSSAQEDIVSSTSAPKRVFKILRTKTPKLLVDRPLIEETSVIKTDDENQELENENPPEVLDQRLSNEKDGDDQENQNAEEEPSRPILKFPTRNSANRVTIKRRPAYNINSRTSTVHPASTRFSKDSLPTRAKSVTVRRKFKPTVFSSDVTAEEIEPEKKAALGERNKKIFSKGYRKSLSTTSAPNITPLTDTETTDLEEEGDTTVLPFDNNDENISQKQSSPSKPRFSLSRFTTTTTVRPTTLHHVFAIDVDEESGDSKNKTTIKENNADEVIKKLQKLIEINRIVEVYSKEEKFRGKNKKLIKQTDLTVEKPPKLETFGEISRETIIKLVKRNETTTESPESRSAKSVVFAETVFSQLESSTISLEGLFDREKKSNDNVTEVAAAPAAESADSKPSASTDILRAPAPLLRPESNETNPIIISLASLDQVILSKVKTSLDDDREKITTTDIPVEDTTSVASN